MTVTDLRGVVHGKMIELDRDPGLPDGQEIRLTIQPVANNRLPAGEGLRRSFGGWAEDGAELYEFLEWNRHQRKQGRRELDS